jgi:hypothetical protein
MLGVPGTGREAVNTGITIFCLADGRVAEMWMESDNVRMVQQIGAMPMSAGA